MVMRCFSVGLLEWSFLTVLPAGCASSCCPPCVDAGTNAAAAKRLMICSFRGMVFEALLWKLGERGRFSLCQASSFSVSLMCHVLEPLLSGGGTAPLIEFIDWVPVAGFRPIHTMNGARTDSEAT
jgi:hypothetical protein